MHEIRPRLYLGSIHAATDRDTLAARGITHVVSVAECDIGHRQRVRLEPSKEDPCTRLVVAVQDAASSRLDRHFDACSAFIAEGLAKGAVLVHCKAGQSRSPTVVIAHLMQQEGWDMEKALRFVQQRRPKVQPNAGFMEQLRGLEVRLGAHEHVVAADGKADAAQLEARVNAFLSAADADFHGRLSRIYFNCIIARMTSSVVCREVVTSATQQEAAERSIDDELVSVVSAADVQVEVCDLLDREDANEARLRCERFRKQCQRLRTASGILGMAAPLRKRRHR